MNIANGIGNNGIVQSLKRGWGRRTVIGIPYGFLILFFSVPFLVVLKISVSSTDELGIHFQDLTSYANGIVELKIKLSNYIFLTTDPLYIKTYLSSIKFAAINTFICLIIGYPFAYFMARSPAAMRPALLMMVSLPFWTSYLLRVYAWKGLLRRQWRDQQHPALAACHRSSDQDDVHRFRHDHRHGLYLCAVHDIARLCHASEDGFAPA